MDSVEFRIPRGQVVGLLGPNGAGKTTTIRMITGYLPPTSGTVTVDGLDVVRQSLAVRQRIGYLPESAPLYGDMRVQEFLGFRARLFDVPRARRAAAIDRAVERCWLEPVRRRPIHQLSKGYRQRVGLAAALLHDPPVLILDEPTVGLDPAQIREARSLIRELAGDHTVVLSTHILPEVELTCDRVIMMARGRIYADGALAELRSGAGRDEQYLVETTADAAPVLESIDGVRCVGDTSLEGGWRQLTVEADAGAGDLREAIGERLSVMGATVRELHRVVPSLEQLFIRMMTETSAGPGEPPATPRRSRRPARESEEVRT
ncbi:MAG: ABC transporter ATP-binding protein [Planctomycetota bacterium]